MRSTRRPGRSKRGSDAILWPGGLWVGDRYVRPIAGGESNPPKPGENDPPKGDGSPDDEKSPKPDDERKFTQADLDRHIDERLKREREKAEAATAKAKREAEEAAAAKQGEFQTLAEKRAERIAALEADLAAAQAHKERADKYEAALAALLAQQRKGLPGHVTELLDKLDPADQLAWIAKNAEALGGAAAGKNGPPASPRANGSPAADAVEENRKKLAATGAYGRF